MRKFKLAVMAIVFMGNSAFAGGLLTNTNQSINFLRNPARGGAIGIDGTYSNPAGVAFLSDGLHISVDLQNVHQERKVSTTFLPFAYGARNLVQAQAALNGGLLPKDFKGDAVAPILPSLHAAYNKGKLSLQFNFGVEGGGGKCIFTNGLPSFESNVAMLPLLSKNMDAFTTAMGLGTLGLPTVDGYNMDTYMRGRQYYFGLRFGAAYKVTDNLSVYGGIRALYGTGNYFGYVRNIQAIIGGQNVPASQTFYSGATDAVRAIGYYTAKAEDAAAAGDAAAAATYAAAAKQANVKAVMLNALGEATQDVMLNCDQEGWGFAPVLGIDYKIGRFNLAAKYEFRVAMRLMNRATNSESAANLEMLDRWKDGTTVREDTPALLTLGGQWSPIDKLRIMAGWHLYFDKDSKKYENAQKKLGGNTMEYLFGAEYDINDKLEVSAGTQFTRYKMTQEFIEDLSFNVNSYSFGFGVGYHVTDKIKLNAAYFQTNYSTFDRMSQNYNNLSAMAGKIVGSVSKTLATQQALSQGATQEQAEAIAANTATQNATLVGTALTTPNAQGVTALYGKDSFTRTNRVIGVGVEFTF